MTLLVMTIFFVLVGGGLTLVWVKNPEIGTTKARRQAIRERKERDALRNELSWPSYQIYLEYEGLPEDSRPGYDILATLRALDTQYRNRYPTNDEINVHYVDRTSRNYHSEFLAGYVPRYHWRCACNNPYTEYERCIKMPEYREMKVAMENVKAAVAARDLAIEQNKHKMVLMGLESDLSNVKSITDALRQEAQALNEVTKEIEK